MNAVTKLHLLAGAAFAALALPVASHAADAAPAGSKSATVQEVIVTADERARMRERLFDWMATGKRRTTVSDDLVGNRTDAHRAHGIHIGIW